MGEPTLKPVAPAAIASVDTAMEPDDDAALAAELPESLQPASSKRVRAAVKNVVIFMMVGESTWHQL